MKIAWLCYTQNGWDDEDSEVTIVFEEPEEYLYDKIVPIVYAEIVK